jgi:hypothetical protein
VDHYCIPVFCKIRRVHQELELGAEYLHTSVIFLIPGFILDFWHEATEIVFEIQTVVFAKIFEETAEHFIDDVDRPPNWLLGWR